MVDLARFQAPTLEEDLRMRDFTVKRHGDKVGHEPGTGVDPLHGLQDMKR